MEKKDLDGAMNRAFKDKKGIFSKIKGKEVKEEEVPKADKVEIVHEEKKGLFGFFKGYKERREEKERRFEFKDIKK